jgi:hypothetical protein
VRSTTHVREAALALGVLGLALTVVRAGAEEIEPVPIPTLVAPAGRARSTGEVLVRFRDDVDAGRRWQILGANGARVTRVHHGSGYVVMQPRTSIRISTRTSGTSSTAG